LRVEHFQKCVIVLVEQDECAGGGAEFHGSSDVIDVGMGDDDLLDLQVVLADHREDVINIISRVDDHGFAGGLVADDGAVALQRADGEDFVDHGFIVQIITTGDTGVAQSYTGGELQRSSCVSLCPLW
jgi:hypothetical protein